LIFDQPRHKTVVQLPVDYPRINQFPEWYTVEFGEMLDVTEGSTPSQRRGAELIRGIEVSIKAGGTVRFSVSKPLHLPEEPPERGS
jgi:hypothetical protein